MKLIILALLYVTIHCEDFDMVSTVRTPYLAQFTNYIDGVVVSFQVPSGSSSVLFKFLAEEVGSTMYSCTARNVSLYLKHGSLPVIDPDHSRFPDNFKEITRSELYYFEFESNQVTQNLILKSPEPGPWYFIALLSNSDTSGGSFQLGGTNSQCSTQVGAALFTSTEPKIGEITENNKNTAVITANVYYKFFVPKSVDHALLMVDEVVFGSGVQSLTVRVQSNTIPSKNNTIKSETIEATSANIPFATVENSWHFFEFLVTGSQEATSSFTFDLKFFFNVNNTNDYDEYGDSVSKIYRSDYIENVIPYKQYDLVRRSTTRTFSYSFDLRKNIETSLPLPVNLTSTDFTALKFELREITDTGGTLQIILSLLKDRKLPKNHKVIGCVRANSPEIPVWPNLCRHELTDTVAPLLVDESTEEATIQIPYPETGVWFVTFKLFCGECQPCKCPGKCQENFEACSTDCEATCVDAQSCNDCGISCKEEIVANQNCSKCNCEGPCVSSETECDASIFFDVTSFPCVGGSCGDNGRCTLAVSDGIVYSTCVCNNNYRGWDCSDDSHAHSLWVVLLELNLLVLSNLFFLPAAFVAYRRRYYVEALVYLSICFFSSFYHACDAGENVASFCITTLGALQFGDFFCALLSIWVTGIAIADVPPLWTHFFHILGAIILAFITTINKTSVGVLAVPAPIGILIIGISWYKKYRKTKGRFINERYLYTYIPIGVAIVTVGLIIFASLETDDNYKYLHSLWHILMAAAVIVVLPRPDTFQPETRC